MADTIYMLSIIVITVILTLIVAHKALGRSQILPRIVRAGQVRDMAVQCDRIDTHEIACQSQCTYTAVRKSVGPYRFQPLPDNSHGTFHRYMEH